MFWRINNKDYEMKKSEYRVCAVTEFQPTDPCEPIEDCKKRIINNFIASHDVAVFQVEFIVKPAPKWMLDEAVQTYQRADGQYIYHGDFKCREWIEEQLVATHKMLVARINYLETGTYEQALNS